MTVATLQDVQHKVLRDLLGTFCAAKAGLSIDANTNDVETDNAIDYFIGGIGYTKAAQTAIDISGLGAPSEGTNGVGVSVANLYTQVFLFQINAAGTITVVAGDAVLTADITAGTKDVSWPNPSADCCPFGAVKIVNTSGSAFVFGTTTGMATYATYYDLCRVPAV